MIEFKDTKMTKQQYDVKMTCVQTCSNEEMDATNGLSGFFEPKNIYIMLGSYRKIFTNALS